MKTPNTGSAGAHPSDARSVSDLASDLHLLLRRCESLRIAIDDAADFNPASEKDAIKVRLGRICDFLALQEDVLANAIDLADQIEGMGLASRRTGEG